MSDDRPFELLKLEYAAIRAEILQSISYQHQILLAGYGATGVFTSYILAKSAVPPSVNYIPALILVPFILLGMASLWIVECNRMVRASYYIGAILWRCMREGCAPPIERWECAEWECWIRSKEQTGSRTNLSDFRIQQHRVASAFRARQDRSQKIVVLWGPLFLSCVASGVAIWDAWRTAPSVPVPIFSTHTLATILIAASAGSTGIWWRVWKDLKGISDLEATPIE